MFSADRRSVLLCRRANEVDYDGVYSFIGGKMETTDLSTVDALRREKDEEVGANFKIKAAISFTVNCMYTKLDQNIMILPHYYAQHLSGELELSREYSGCRWVELSDLAGFEPKVENVFDIATELLRLTPIFKESDFVIF